MFSSLIVVALTLASQVGGTDRSLSGRCAGQPGATSTTAQRCARHAHATYAIPRSPATNGASRNYDASTERQSIRSIAAAELQQSANDSGDQSERRQPATWANRSRRPAIRRKTVFSANDSASQPATPVEIGRDDAGDAYAAAR